MKALLLLTSLVATIIAAATNSRVFRREDVVSAPYVLKKGPLDTNWTTEVGTNPWPEYPRPLLQRSQWKNLNGVWQYENVIDGKDFKSPPFGQNLKQSALVPFCLESALSGIMENKRIWSWYKTTFDVPSEWSKDNRVLLNFGAVDYEATVYLNSKEVTHHIGGYDEFTMDITDQVSTEGPNELFVAVYDPTDKDDVQIPLGKQTHDPSHIFYTPCSGIWQTVWIESAPSTHITQMFVDADMHGNVNMMIKTNDGSAANVEVVVAGAHTYGQPPSKATTAVSKQKTNTDFSFKIENPQLWSPDSPTLYNITVKLGDDVVDSYVGFRTISRAEVNGVQRPLLNGKFLFHFGTLDQGYWPDGIHSPPSVEAMRYDLEVLKKIGYNMVRKHIKVEPALWYRACDELGLLVIQDMPSMRTRVPNPQSTKPKECQDSVPVADPANTKEFGRQLEIMVDQHKSYPSLVIWTIYNEAWGQIDDGGASEREFTARVRELDPTRLVNTVSGWYDHDSGSDFHDNHKYASPQCGTPFYSFAATPYDPTRIGLQGEFAGLGHNVSIEHLWNVPKAIAEIDRTYEIDESLEAWNYRAHVLLMELRDQIERFACSAAVWTQTTDVEGEVNGMLTYDRRILRPDLTQWNDDIKALYETAQKRGGDVSIDVPERKVEWRTRTVETRSAAGSERMTKNSLWL